MRTGVGRRLSPARERLRTCPTPLPPPGGRRASPGSPARPRDPPPARRAWGCSSSCGSGPAHPPADGMRRSRAQRQRPRRRRPRQPLPAQPPLASSASACALSCSVPPATGCAGRSPGLPCRTCSTGSRSILRSMPGSGSSPRCTVPAATCTCRGRRTGCSSTSSPVRCSGRCSTRRSVSVSPWSPASGRPTCS